MIDKELLNQIESLHKEYNDINKRLKQFEINSKTIVSDSVQGSDEEFPYTKHNFKVKGVKMFKPKYSKSIYKKMLNSSKHKLDKAIKQLEYQLNSIEDKDSEIRRIIRYKYEDNLSWIQVMFKMEYKSESTAKVKLKRFLEKL